MYDFHFFPELEPQRNSTIPFSLEDLSKMNVRQIMHLVHTLKLLALQKFPLRVLHPTSLSKS